MLRRLRPSLGGSAAAASPQVVSARALYQSGRFAEALAVLDEARGGPALTDADRSELLQLLARVQLAEGLEPQAIETFEELVRHEPSFSLPADTSPRIAAALEAAKKAAFRPGHVELIGMAAPLMTLRARLVDPWANVAKIVLFRRGVSGWVAAELRPDKGGVITQELRRGDVAGAEYYLEAVGVQDQVLARLGTPEAPLVSVNPEALTSPVDHGPVNAQTLGVAVGLGVAVASAAHAGP